MTLEQLMASYRAGEIDSNRVLETLQRQFGQDSATAQRTLQSFDRGTGPIWGLGLGEDIGQAASDVGGFFKRLGGGIVPGTMANIIAGAGAQQLFNFFGQDDNDLSSEQIKARLQADVVDRDEAINLLTRNTGMSRSDAINTVTGWESETLTNIPLKQAWGDQWRRFREQVRALPGQVAERVTGSPAGQAVGGVIDFAGDIPNILDRPLADTFGGETTGTFDPGIGRSPEQLLDMGGGSPAYYFGGQGLSPEQLLGQRRSGPMGMANPAWFPTRTYGPTPTGTWTGEPIDPITGLRTDTRGIVERASGRQQTLRDFADDPAMGFDAFTMPSARPPFGTNIGIGRARPSSPAASAAVDAVSRNMVSPTPIMDVDETVLGGFGGIAPSGVAPTPSVAPSVPAAPTGPAGRVMDLPTGPNVYQGTTITGTPPPFEVGDEFWQMAQSEPEMFKRFKLSQFPGASLGDIQSEAGQRFLTQGYYPAMGQLKLAQAMGLAGVGLTPEQQFGRFLGDQDRLSLEQIRQGFGGLGDYLNAQAQAASAGIDPGTAGDPLYAQAFKGLDRTDLVSAAQAALGTTGGARNSAALYGMFDVFQTQYGPTGGKKAFVDWVGTALPGYADRTPYVSSFTAPAVADIDYDPTRSTAATAPATPAAPIRKLAERKTVSPQMKIGFDTSKPFVPSTPPEVKKLAKLKTFTPEQQQVIQNLRPTSSDVIELQAKANMIPGGGGYIGGGWSPEVTKATYDALEDDLLMGGDGLGMGTPTKKKKKKFGSTLLKKFVGR